MINKLKTDELSNAELADRLDGYSCYGNAPGLNDVLEAAARRLRMLSDADPSPQNDAPNTET